MDFNQAEKRFKDLKEKFEAGSLSENEFKTQLEELMVQDESGSWWMIGYETEQWYRYDGKAWVQSDPQGSRLQKSKPKIETSILEKKSKAQESLWKFGKKEIIQSLIGVVIFILLYYPFRGVYEFRFWSPAYATPLFFGLTFGPMVGAIVGAISYIFTYPLLSGAPISEFIYYFSNFALYSYVTKGLIMGIAKVPIKQFRSLRGVFRVELFVIIAIIAPAILFTEWAAFIRDSDFRGHLMTDNILPSLLGNLVLIPISMIIYSLILARIKSRKK